MSRPKNPRLQFTDAERGDPRLKEHIRRADKAADQADAARKKVPKKKKPVKQRTVDPATGKAKTRLRFEEVDKPAPVSKLTHAVQAAPVHAAAGTVHRKISETEHDNVGVESAHRLEESAEGGARLAAHSCRSQKLRPYREAAKAERKLEQANVNVLYQKHIRVVIPKEIRRTMRIREGDPSQITLEPWERFCFGVLDLERRMGWGT